MVTRRARRPRSVPWRGAPSAAARAVRSSARAWLNAGNGGWAGCPGRGDRRGDGVGRAEQRHARRACAPVDFAARGEDGGAAVPSINGAKGTIGAGPLALVPGRSDSESHDGLDGRGRPPEG